MKHTLGAAPKILSSRMEEISAALVDGETWSWRTAAWMAGRDLRAT